MCLCGFAGYNSEEQRSCAEAAGCLARFSTVSPREMDNGKQMFLSFDSLPLVKSSILSLHVWMQLENIRLLSLNNPNYSPILFHFYQDCTLISWLVLRAVLWFFSSEWSEHKPCFRALASVLYKTTVIDSYQWLNSILWRHRWQRGLYGDIFLLWEIMAQYEFLSFLMCFRGVTVQRTLLFGIVSQCVILFHVYCNYVCSSKNTFVFKSNLNPAIFCPTLTQLELVIIRLWVWN